MNPESIVLRWTGVEVKALREASRMSLVEFAERLGVSERIVSKWEANSAEAKPRPVNQAALDTLLASADPDVFGRFKGLLTIDGREPPQLVAPEGNPIETGRYVRHPVDGKYMTEVPEGIYLSGRDNEPVWEGGFYIDVFPVTNADYARFCAATTHPAPTYWEDGRCASELLNHPVVNVSWLDASAYASWAGKQLPTSTQWEKAARGTAGGVFPWGDQPTPAKCNVRETRIESTTDVDRFHSGVSPYQVYDLVGNVWEWCSTPSSPGRFELKGSAWTSPLFRGEPSAFNDANEFMQDDDTGFRCVAEQPPTSGR